MKTLKSKWILFDFVFIILLRDHSAIFHWATEVWIPVSSPNVKKYFTRLGFSGVALEHGSEDGRHK